MDRSGAAAKEDGVTLFVFNLPEKLHWKGLWALFSYHGDVLDAYIPSKRSKEGQRFGFIRYASMEDAMRAQERLDGFPLYGYRVRVHLARFEPAAIMGEAGSIGGLRTSIQREGGRWKKQELCVVCKFWRAEDLAKKFQEEEIKDASIMRLSGTIFLLTFKDHESLEGFLREHEAALKKWYPDFHAWNEVTIENIASLWGDLISVDVRTVKPSSFYIAYFQILTNYSDRINETIELDVSSKVFKVRVCVPTGPLLQCEFEPAFTRNSVWCAEEEESDSFTLDDAFEKQKLNAEFEGQGDESVESSTENLEVELSVKVLCQDERVTNVTLNESERQLDLEGRSADIVAREKVADFAREDSEDPSAIIKAATSLDRLDFSSNGKDSTHPTEALLVNNMIIGEVSPPINLVTVDRAKDAQNINTVNFQEQNDVGIAMGVRTVDENLDFYSFPVEEDVRSLELGKHVAWADKVDRANSVNSASVLFPEMQDFHRRISKKYASMLDLQDRQSQQRRKNAEIEP
ncbi:hypothetical protein GQ457_08G035060 [Hibiscus cannabinus]